MVHTRVANKAQPFKASTLNILTLDESTLDGDNAETNNAAAVRVPSSTGSAAPKSGSEKMPTSFQGFDMKTDPQIRRQAKKSWFDIDDNSSTATTPFVSASPFEGISGNVPAFPPPSAEDLLPSQEELVAAVEEEEATVAAPSPATPTKGDDEQKLVSSPPLKPGQQDADGAEAFEQGQQTFEQLPTYQPAPQYNQYQQYHQQQFGARSVQPRHGAFRSHHHQEQTRIQQQQFQTPPPPPPPRRQEGAPSAATTSPAPEQDTGVPNLQSRPANHELMGFLPFYKFDDIALNADLPSAEMLGAQPQRHPKLFLGHVWSKVPTGVVQWMLNSFGPSNSTAFGPQLHYNREGWFRGCLHTSVITEDPQALIYALHKRVLFDHEGVWFAETADQMRILDDYCRRLRALPQQIRHTKLQSLPCNPLACELARNE